VDGVAVNRRNRMHRLWLDEGLTCKPRAREEHRPGPVQGEEAAHGPVPAAWVSFDFQST
jgi:hypothetical protein